MEKSVENQIEKLIKEVGIFQRAEQAKLSRDQINEKSLNQLVSYVDVESEKQLVQGLTDVMPGSGFVTEEETVETTESEYMWIIDPLDGTTNYIFNHNVYSISVALQRNKETVFGVVYLPSLDEYYFANQEGSYKNNRIISVSQQTELNNTLLATGFPYYKFDEMDDYMSALSTLMRSTKGIRRMGSAAIDLAYTAEGKFDAYFELNLNPWDIAAGAYIVKQAGGVVIDFDGGTTYAEGKQIIAGNAAIVQDIQNILKANNL